MITVTRTLQRSPRASDPSFGSALLPEYEGPMRNATRTPGTGSGASVTRSDTVTTLLPTYETSEQQTGNVILSWSPENDGTSVTRSDTVATLLPTYEVVERQTENTLLMSSGSSETSVVRSNTLLPTYETSERHYRANLSEEQLGGTSSQRVILTSRSPQPSLMEQDRDNHQEGTLSQLHMLSNELPISSMRSRSPLQSLIRQDRAQNHQGEQLGTSSELQNSNGAVALRRRQAVPTTRSTGTLPTYLSAIPTTSIRYSFTSPSSNSMDLIQPSSAGMNPRSIYRVSVSMNCFMPSSYITTLRKIENETEKYVGEFEMGVSNYGNSVKLGERLSSIKNKLIRPSAMNMNTYIWKDDRGQPLYLWEFLTRTKAICRMRFNRNIILGTFWGSPDPTDPFSTEVPNSMFEVTPSGHEHFDELMLSLLVVERARLTPTSAQQPQ
ncbi:hypothetical protein BDQ17DRAFT_1361852 [Cyathus striatus]|nr:hypothetical protein BDQ17DRAFT_1361852 [Cyathus striatus]